MGKAGEVRWGRPTLYLAALVVAVMSQSSLPAAAQDSQQNAALSGDPGAVAGEGLDALAQLPVLNASVHDAGASSHDPNGENGDSGNYLYQDAQGTYVLMEAEGPGVIDRIWVTGSLTNGGGSSARSFGNLEFFFDGETTPRIDLPADTFFSGTSPPFLAPLCGNGGASSGGFYCNVRMPFAKSVRVVSTGVPAYYNIGYETYPAGTPVQTFEPTSSNSLETSEAEAVVANRAGSNPDILPAGATGIGGATISPARPESFRIFRMPGPSAPSRSPSIRTTMQRCKMSGCRHAGMARVSWRSTHPWQISS